MTANTGGVALKMKRVKTTVVIVAVCAFAALCVSGAQAVSFTATLKGSNEVPPNASTNAGRTRFTLDPVTFAVSWVTKTTITTNVGHHLHSGAVGVNGPVIVNFGGLYSGTGVVSSTQAAAIVANPANFYVNLHTTAFPGGEIRGPLVADPLTCTLDIDDDGEIDATTDGLIITRAMLGLTGTAVTDGAIGTNALRTSWADIRSFLNTRCGAGFLP
jgi:CHRD domain